MIIVFVIGYMCIAMEHIIKIDKAAISLLIAGIMWSVYILVIPESGAGAHPEAFQEYLSLNPSINDLSYLTQCRRFITEFQLIEYMGDISSTLFFLIGAMTIVELIDAHHGFDIITDRITTKDKRRLLWLISIIAFFMSAVLDNLTTSIVMVTLVKKIVPNYKERWIFGGMIIISANSGGAWSPIGDVTTIMLWIKGMISSWPLIKATFLSSLVSTLLPLILATRLLKEGAIPLVDKKPRAEKEYAISRRERAIILVLGVGALLSVPVFKYVTTLPPFAGVLTALSLLWIYTEILYSNLKISESAKNRVTKIIKKIDTATILFFLGILLSVMSLQANGSLIFAGNFLNSITSNSNVIAMTMGVLSAIIDNVPLVAVSMGIYPVSHVATSAFIMDGTFWHFLAYCAGTGGSMLIIGSAAGVVVMGLEKISFTWYLKNISLLALLGFVAGCITFLIIN